MFYQNNSIPRFGEQYEQEMKKNDDARTSLKHLNDGKDNTVQLYYLTGSQYARLANIKETTSLGLTSLPIDTVLRQRGLVTVLDHTTRITPFALQIWSNLRIRMGHEVED